MRSKEGAKDYRFFPEPDLPPLYVAPQVIESIRTTLPELPNALKERLIATYGLTTYESAVLVNESGAAAFFETIINQTNPRRPAKLVVNWILNELFSYIKATNGDMSTNPVSPEAFGELLDLVVDGTISGKIAKDVLPIMFYEPTKSALNIVDSHNWRQIQDEEVIRTLCLDVLRDPVSLQIPL